MRGEGEVACRCPARSVRARHRGGVLRPPGARAARGSVNWQYWVIDLWLFPLLDALGLVLVLGGTSALVSRIVALRLGSRAPGGSQPAEPVSRTLVRPDATGPREST
ncbi:hypothetical protein JM654_11495 [Microbacterium oxydans]|nr:hypothetical protein [Microbacterium oxydans]